jgi:hypothetical protein
MARSRKPGTTEGTDQPDYEVGYRKPPLAHRFKPGQSGNPKGRKRRSVNVSTTLRNLLSEPRKVRIGEHTRTLTTTEVMLRRLVERVVQGDIRAFNVLVELVERYLPDALSQVGQRVLAGEDLAMLQDFLVRRSRISPRNGGQETDEP